MGDGGSLASRTEIVLAVFNISSFGKKHLLSETYPISKIRLPWLLIPSIILNMVKLCKSFRRINDTFYHRYPLDTHNFEDLLPAKLRSLFRIPHFHFLAAEVGSLNIPLAWLSSHNMLFLWISLSEDISNSLGWAVATRSNVTLSIGKFGMFISPQMGLGDVADVDIYDDVPTIGGSVFACPE